MHFEWLNFQTASQGPMLGQAHHFLKFNKGKSTYSEERYHKEAERIYNVMNTKLKDSKYLGVNLLTLKQSNNISKKIIDTLSSNLNLPVTDIIRWKDEKFIDHIEKSIFR